MEEIGNFGNPLKYRIRDAAVLTRTSTVIKEGAASCFARRGPNVDGMAAQNETVDFVLKLLGEAE